MKILTKNYLHKLILQLQVYKQCVKHIMFVLYFVVIQLYIAHQVNKKAQLSLTNPRDACEKFARFT